MATTWGNLKSEARKIIFPTGEASSLVLAHDAAFLAAIIDIQSYVDCARQDNTSIFPQCATFYNCGITTFDAPRGHIKKVSVINATPAPPPTGTIVLTTAIAADILDAAILPVSIGAIPSSDLYVVEITGQGSKCGTPVKQYFKVDVTYTDAESKIKTFSRNVYLSDCETSQIQQINTLIGTNVFVAVTPFNIPEVESGGATIGVNVRQFNPLDVTTQTDDWCSEIQYRQTEPAYVQKYWKRSLEIRGCLNWWSFFDLKPPTPTDANVPAGLPILPLGYHYPQADTDKRFRSQYGLWATERGKIYIAPFIQSTETVIVKWDGIKRTWADADPIDDDPNLAKAIRAFVRRDHFQYFDKDPESAAGAQAEYADTLATMIHECREETRIRDNNEPSFARQSNPAASGALYYNSKQTFTANCPAGQTGNSVTITIQDGLVASSTSQSDADARALQQAQQQALAQLNCSGGQTTYLNTPQSFTAVCQGSPTPDGIPQTVNIPAGQFTSVISQADADAQALASAQAQAQALLVCTFWNAEQSYTASCPSGQTGTPVTKTVSQHTFSSDLSQSDANSKALNSAKTQAQTELVCNGQTIFFENTPQIAIRSYVFGSLGNQCLSTVTVNVAAGSVTSLTSVSDANNQALNYANSLAQGTAQNRARTGFCGPYTINV